MVDPIMRQYGLSSGRPLGAVHLVAIPPADEDPLAIDCLG